MSSVNLTETARRILRRRDTPSHRTDVAVPETDKASFAERLRAALDD